MWIDQHFDGTLLPFATLLCTLAALAVVLVTEGPSVPAASRGDTFLKARAHTRETGAGPVGLSS
jgi:hypothetical protein